MPVIHLTTFIAAPVERVFDLCRSVHLHKMSMSNYKEEAIAGTTSGLIKMHDTVTWRAKHLLKSRTLKVKITSFQAPFYFTDEQVKGDFKMMKHKHYFKEIDNGTIMIDMFYFETPYGAIGKFLNKFYLTKYLQRLLEERNKEIKNVAESNRWKHILPH